MVQLKAFSEFKNTHDAFSATFLIIDINHIAGFGKTLCGIFSL